MRVQFKTFKQELCFSLWMIKRSGWWWDCVFWGLLPWLLRLHMMHLIENQGPPALEQLVCSDKGMTWSWKLSLKWSACSEIRDCLWSCRVKCCLLEFCKDQLIKGSRTGCPGWDQLPEILVQLIDSKGNKNCALKNILYLCQRNYIFSHSCNHRFSSSPVCPSHLCCS